MLPGTEKRKPRNSSKVNLLISLTFHSLIVLAVLLFCRARGLAGQAVEEDRRRDGQGETAGKAQGAGETKGGPIAQGGTAQAGRGPQAGRIAQDRRKLRRPPPPWPLRPPSLHPRPRRPPSSSRRKAVVDASPTRWNFTKDRSELALRSSWDRPQDMDDQSFVAESGGRGGFLRANRRSRSGRKAPGNKRWDDSVRQAIAKTRSVSRAAASQFSLPRGGPFRCRCLRACGSLNHEKNQPAAATAL